MKTPPSPSSPPGRRPRRPSRPRRLQPARLALASSLAALALAGAGCSSYSVRPGIWELTFQAERMDTGTPFAIEPKLVRVIVGPLSDENDPSVKEGIDIESLDPEAPTGAKAGSPNAGRNLKKLLGNISFVEGHEPTVSIRHREPSWDFAMLGIVKSPEWITGTQLRGKVLYQDPPIFADGTWNMKWLRDE